MTNTFGVAFWIAVWGARGDKGQNLTVPTVALTVVWSLWAARRTSAADVEK